MWHQPALLAQIGVGGSVFFPRERGIAAADPYIEVSLMKQDFVLAHYF